VRELPVEPHGRLSAAGRRRRRLLRGGLLLDVVVVVLQGATCSDVYASSLSPRAVPHVCIHSRAENLSSTASICA
jgi:hypothetical protein